MSIKSDIPAHIDLIARLILIFFSAGFGVLAYYLYSSAPAIGFFASSFIGLVFAVLATIGPRSVRVGIASSLPWF